MSPLNELYELLSAQYPAIVGLSGSVEDGWRIDWEGTPDQADVDAAQAIANAFTPTPDPDWKAFRSALVANTTWARVLNTNPSAAAAVVAAMWQVGQDPSVIADVKTLWDATLPLVDPALSPQEIDGLNSIAQAHNIPVSLNSSGEMIIG